MALGDSWTSSINNSVLSIDAIEIFFVKKEIVLWLLPHYNY